MDLEEKQREEVRAEIDKRKIKLNKQAYLLIQRTQKGENIPFQDFLKIFDGKTPLAVFNLLEEELSEKFQTIFTQRLETHLQELINNYSESKRSKFLVEVESLTHFFYLLSPETKSKLEQIIKPTINSTLPAQTKYLPWIISSFVILFVTIGLMF
jgi:hypothetical protein